MSIIYNNQVVAGKYTQQVVADADTVNAGIIKIATEEQINEGTDNTTAVTPFYLAQKQDKIYAGDGIIIDNNEISCTVNPDEQTIVRKNNGTMQCIGQLTKSNTLKFDWEGTQAEYNVAYLNGTIQPDWYCYITDDESIVDYGDVANQSLSNLKQEGEDRFNNKANIDLDNLSNVGQSKLDIKADKATTLEGYGITDGLNKNQITNCITEIPQRIKYTLEGGILTIKAGSVVIVPYGTEDLTADYPIGSTFLNDNFKVYDTQFADGNFFVWSKLQADIVSNFAWTGTYTNNFAYIDINNNELFFKQIGVSLSGNTWGGSFTTLNAWYNTISNTVKEYQADGIVTREIGSLPLLTFDNTASVITSVNQVFNGIGYIGSTVWVDKGVKGLIPNGRNEDGTLRNIEFIVPNLWLTTIPEYRADWKLYIEPSINSLRLSSVVTYISELNKNHYDATDSFIDVCYISRVINENETTQISAFNPKQPFRAVDYSDSSTVSGWGFPSDKVVDLTLGATGTTYTAPANGWVIIELSCSYLAELSINAYYGSSYIAYNTSNPWNGNYPLRLSIPVAKGNTFRIWYTNLVAKNRFQFIYAEGEK